MVIGILIALSINNWNEQCKQNIQEHQLLTGLKAEMEENIRSLKIIIGEHNIATDTVNTLFGLYRKEAENV